MVFSKAPDTPICRVFGQRRDAIAIAGFIIVLLFLGAVFGPHLWVQHVFKRHGEDRPDFPGTGGEMAEHLIENFGLDGVKLEATDGGDHYDPASRTVRLSKDNMAGRSLTAVAIAAHEVGHALQHARGDGGLKLRQTLAAVAVQTDKIASVFFIAAPLLTIVIRTPAAFFGLVAIGIALLAVRVIFNIVTLPVEYDASFGKALPILREGRYLSDDDMAGATQVLKAAALTYVAGALMSLLNLARWIRFLR